MSKCFHSRPVSSSMIMTFWPFGVGEECSSIMGVPLVGEWTAATSYTELAAGTEALRGQTPGPTPRSSYAIEATHRKPCLGFVSLRMTGVPRGPMSNLRRFLRIGYNRDQAPTFGNVF